MLISKEWCDEGVDCDGKKLEFWRRKAIVLPGCCEASSQALAPYLSYSFKQWDRTDTDEYSIKDEKPSWVMPSHSWQRIESFYIDLPFEEKMKRIGAPIRFCPYCGYDLPEIEPREDFSGPIWDGDGNYCGTCNERNMSCSCFPPEVRWQVVKW